MEVLNNQNPNGYSRQRKNIKPDMTPMVDLGFLLISFFMLTTTFSNPNIIKLNLPLKEGNASEIGLTNSITFSLGEGDKVYWHQHVLSNLSEHNLLETNYSGNGVRALIIEKLRNSTKSENFTVIIKPTAESKYKNTVDILDEIEISNIKNYALVDIFPSETKAYHSIKEVQNVTYK